MNSDVFEELLHEEESASLDFKRDQYEFAGASDEQKSELLKDILAFANAWRRVTAYILIGVEEIKGGRSNPVGVAHQLSDNDLQQFVNSKTNRPVAFSYRAFAFEGNQFGIIEVPVQSRPVFLKRSYGKLSANTVYVRRGSSTDVADPEEIAKMGSADTGRAAEPAFELEWADLREQRPLGSLITISSEVLEPRLSTASIKPVRNPYGISSLNEPTDSYYTSIIEYAYDSALLTSLGFCIRNTSAVPANSTVVKCRVEKSNGVRFHDYSGQPIIPSRYPHPLSGIRTIAEQLSNDPDPEIASYPGHWELTIPFGKVLPKATVWSTGVVWIGAKVSQVISLEMRIFSDNLPMPQSITLQTNVEATTRAMTRNDLPRST